MTKPLDAYRKQLWPLPLQLHTKAGAVRRLGVEIEFTGMEIDGIVDTIIQQYGGNAEPLSDYEVNVVDTSLGQFGVELDFSYIKRISRERHESADTNDLEELAEAIVGAIAKQLVPFEVVAPPIAMSDLWQLEDLFVNLRNLDAQGTHASAKNAFGLQLNPEMPDCEAATILDYLRAFLCLYEWLKMRCDVDFSRRLTSYVDPFGKDYVRKILKPSYQPNIDQLIDDYLEFNPTRNRALDMLPLFAHIDEPRLRAKVDDDRVKARPTLHYRLPNSLIDDPQWGLIHPYRDWLQVDNLAMDKSRLETVCQAYRNYLDNPTANLFTNWSHSVSQWLIPELL
ncbi:MAG: amidoligase family protein [Zhongshania sp.]|uniref:amidoligase family protein n=1 Tax=Zhongshania sp. TaxID=1971902 RepID=UPI002606E144|nr:amidoligase family protein [Zhongshania sp.]MDF1692824.1 amidoligase family protein [Zhongshania sp.]